MVIVGIMSFPQESANAVGKRFLELPPVPDFLTLKGPYLKSKGKDGIQAFEIYEVDKSQIVEGIESVTDRYVKYFGIPDYVYEVGVYYEAAESLSMIGLA